MYPSVKNPVLVLKETGLKHSRLAEFGKKAIQARPDHPDTGVSMSSGLSVDMHHQAPTSDKTCLLLCSKRNCLTLCHQYQTPLTGQLMHSACLGRI